MTQLNSTLATLSRNIETMSECTRQGLEAERAAREAMEDRLTEAHVRLTDIEETTKALGRMSSGGFVGGSGSVLTRADPTYFDPDRGRMLPNATAAEALGHYMRAIIAGQSSSKDWLEDHGIGLKRVQELEERAGEIHDDELGAYVIPPEFGGVIIGALGQYGVFPAHADIEAMASPRKTFAKDGTDVQVYAIEEHEEIPEVDPSYGQLTLEAKLFGAFTRWSADFEEYGMANQGERWAERFTRAIARKMDQCGFRGDGTSGYNNMVGLLNHADVGVLSLEAGKTSFEDLTYDDIVRLMASVSAEVYEEGNCRFYMSNNMIWLLALLKDGQGRPLLADAREGISRSILGEPITTSAVLPRLCDSAPGAKFLAFGDLRRAFKMGIRTRMAISFSPHAYFRKAQNCLRVLTRFGIKSAYPEAISVLKTADA